MCPRGSDKVIYNCNRDRKFIILLRDTRDEIYDMQIPFPILMPKRTVRAVNKFLLVSCNGEGGRAGKGAGRRGGGGERKGDVS